jgi:hypothetical protein
VLPLQDYWKRISFFTGTKVAEMNVVRHQGKWFKIVPKPYETERQTSEIAWSLIREPLVIPEEAYRKYFEKERENAKVLYPSFRKENAD